MKPTTELFDLIKSLSGNEKRYFRLYAGSIGGKENSAYMRLFNAIDAMPEYNEALLKEKLKKEAFVKQLSVAKNYLFYILLKSLVQSNIESNPNLNLQFSIMQSAILFEKGLIEPCRKQIGLLKRELFRYEDTPLLDRAYELENRIQIKRFELKEALDSVDRQIEVAQSRLDALKYKKIAISIFLKKREISGSFNDEERAEFDALIEPVRQAPPPVQSGTLAMYYYNTCFNFYYGAIKDAEKRLLYAQEVMNVLQASPGFIESNVRLYFSANNNLCQALMGMHDYQAAVEKLTEMKNSPFLEGSLIKREIKTEAYSGILNTEVLLSINNRDYKKSDLLASELGVLNERDKNYMGNFFYHELNFNMAHLLFLSGKFTLALDFLRNILNNTCKFERRDLYTAGRIFELILLYEIDSVMLLRNLSGTALKFLKRSKSLTNFDILLIQYLNQSQKRRSPEMIAELQNNFETSGKGVGASPLSGYIDVELWLNNEMTKNQKLVLN